MTVSVSLLLKYPHASAAFLLLNGLVYAGVGLAVALVRQNYPPGVAGIVSHR